MSNWVGKTLGKVQIEAPIARGGVAEVYLGTHITLHRKVAVKILRNLGEDHSDSLERFEQEARVVAGLRHANIVQVYDFDRVDNDPYLVMEYVQGPSLSKHLYFLHQKKQSMELPQIVRIIRGVASALQYAHRSGIIHRDIKPGNILLASPTTAIEAGFPLPEDFEPVLTDFGLVRFLDSSRKTTTGVTAGTPAYMSPEQAQGEPADGRTDIYSLGIVLYEMLAGKLPFDGETTMSILLKHVTEPPPPILGLPPLIQQVLERALAKHPVDRFQTPMEFANALNAAMDINPATMEMDSIPTGLGPSTISFHNAPTLVEPEKTEPPHRSNWVRIAVLGVLALAAGGFLLFNGFPASEAEISTASPSFTHSAAPTFTVAPTKPSTQTPLPLLLDTSVVLSFQDGNAIADRAVLDAQRMPLAPQGSQYEAWLVSGRKRISLGILELDETGMGTLTFTDPQGANLAAIYNQAEITVEPKVDPSASSSGVVAYTYTLPAEGLANVRLLLAAYNSAPNKTALIQGLYASVRKLDQLAVGMQDAYEAGDEVQVRRNAEAILNLIAGAQSPEYKDWDGDGSVTDDSDGFGLDLNGSSPGYFQAVFSEANKTVKSAGASEPMIAYGEYLKTSVQNLAQWTQQVEQLALAVLESPNSEEILELVALTKTMLTGIDIDNNGTVEPKQGESGAQFAYRYAYSMANMPLANTGLVATSTPQGETTAGGGGGTGGGSGGASTPVLPPGQVKTEKPPNPNKPPTKAPNDGNNNKN